MEELLVDVLPLDTDLLERGNQLHADARAPDRSLARTPLRRDSLNRHESAIRHGDVGDTLKGSVSVFFGISLPAGESSYVSLTLLRDYAGLAGLQFAYQSSLMFYWNGVQVAPPSQWRESTSTTGSVGVGGASSGAMSGFEFDTIVFNATVTGIVDTNTGASLDSTEVTSMSYPYLQAGSVASVVPVPEAAWLLLSGLCVVTCSHRTLGGRSRASSSESSG